MAVLTREPLQLAAGDTVSFLKNLPDYPASQGWSLEYELSGNLSFQFASVASGDSHQVDVAAADTALYVPGNYELRGFAVNAGTGGRAQIYQAPCPVTPNLGAVVQKTFAQKMVDVIESVLLGKAAHDILESDVEGTRIKRLSPAELRKEHAYWFTVRQNEIDGERATAGLPSRNKIKPRFQITSTGPLLGGFNPFSTR